MDIIVAHIYIGACTILKLNATAIVIVYLAILNGDVLFQAIPNYNSPGCTKSCRVSGYRQILQIDITHWAVCIKTATANIILDCAVHHRQVIIAPNCTNTGIGIWSSPRVIFNGKSFDRYIGNSAVNYNTRPRPHKARTIQYARSFGGALQGKRFINCYPFSISCWTAFDNVS